MKKSSQTARRSKRSQSNRRRKTQRKVRGGGKSPLIITPRPPTTPAAVHEHQPSNKSTYHPMQDWEKGIKIGRYATKVASNENFAFREKLNNGTFRTTLEPRGRKKIAYPFIRDIKNANAIRRLAHRTERNRSPQEFRRKTPGKEKGPIQGTNLNEESI
jgi:hypothetical protein